MNGKDAMLTLLSELEKIVKLEQRINGPGDPAMVPWLFENYQPPHIKLQELITKYRKEAE